MVVTILVQSWKICDTWNRKTLLNAGNGLAGFPSHGRGHWFESSAAHAPVLRNTRDWGFFMRES